jgi:hypothetical protein
MAEGKGMIEIMLGTETHPMSVPEFQTGHPVMLMFKKAPELGRRGAKEAIRALSDRFSFMIRNAITGGQAKPPLKPSTLRARTLRGISGTTPLRATGGLLNALNLEWEGELARKVFIDEDPTRGPGKRTNYAVVAELMEGGFERTIPITPKMRKFLAVLYGRAAGRAGGSASAGKAGVVRISVVGRPIWQEARDKIRQEGQAIAEKVYEHAMLQIM